ncbi:MAG: hypothetical protein SFY32_05945 [Bacteroidota bacterium]|nr:hypothetical protein [Bacteroidota bacterium]
MKRLQNEAISHDFMKIHDIQTNLNSYHKYLQNQKPSKLEKYVNGILYTASYFNNFNQSLIFQRMSYAEQTQLYSFRSNYGTNFPNKYIVNW